MTMQLFANLIVNYPATIRRARLDLVEDMNRTIEDSAAALAAFVLSVLFRLYAIKTAAAENIRRALYAKKEERAALVERVNALTAENAELKTRAETTAADVKKDLDRMETAVKMTEAAARLAAENHNQEIKALEKEIKALEEKNKKTAADLEFFRGRSVDLEIDLDELKAEIKALKTAAAKAEEKKTAPKKASRPAKKTTGEKTLTEREKKTINTAARRLTIKRFENDFFANPFINADGKKYVCNGAAAALCPECVTGEKEPGAHDAATVANVMKFFDESKATITLDAPTLDELKQIRKAQKEAAKTAPRTLSRNPKEEANLFFFKDADGKKIKCVNINFMIDILTITGADTLKTDGAWIAPVVFEKAGERVAVLLPIKM